MSCYEALAGAYDALTEDVGYAQRADFLEKLLRRSAIPVKLVLDLACGTGTMTWLLTQRGYEVIGVDGSEDMLAAAMSKGGQAAGVPPVSCTSPCRSWICTARWTRRCAAWTV